MDIEKIRQVIEELTGLMDSKKLVELEIEDEGFKVALRRAGRAGESQALVLAPHAAAPASGPAPAQEPPGDHEEAEDVHIVRSLMVGTFYRAPAPDADAFVEVGDEVTPDTVVCIIEAMKVMNEVKAEVEGTIQAIRAENGEAVEYGQPLFAIARGRA